MPLNPYLFFDGTCREAFTFYADVLGGKIEAMMPHRGTPAEKDAGPEMLDKIIHAQLVLPDGSVLMASDSPPQYKEAMKGFSVAIHITDPKEAERVFSALSKGGTVNMPIDETFFAQKFGMAVDRFGVPWMVNCPPAK